MQRFYSEQLKITEETDAVTPRLDIRMNKNGSGFLFASTYEREQKMMPLKDIEVTVENEKGNIRLPSFSASADEFLLFRLIFSSAQSNTNIFLLHLLHTSKRTVSSHIFSGRQHTFRCVLLFLIRSDFRGGFAALHLRNIVVSLAVASRCSLFLHSPASLHPPQAALRRVPSRAFGAGFRPFYATQKAHLSVCFALFNSF